MSHSCCVGVAPTGVEISLMHSCVVEHAWLLLLGVEFIESGDGMPKLKMKGRRSLFADFVNQAADGVCLPTVGRGQEDMITGPRIRQTEQAVDVAEKPRPKLGLLVCIARASAALK